MTVAGARAETVTVFETETETETVSVTVAGARTVGISSALPELLLLSLKTAAAVCP